MGNNLQKQQVFGAVLSLYVSRLARLVNQKGGVPSSLVFDDIPTLYLNHMDNLLATSRSNGVATTLSVLDFSQIKQDYGRDGAGVLMDIAGNILAGQVTGDAATQLSERFDQILQSRQGYSINRIDTLVSQHLQLDAAILPFKMAIPSSGEFVGILSIDIHQPIEQ